MGSDIGKAILLFIGGFVTLLLVMTVFSFGIGTWMRETAGFRGKTAQIEKTRANGDYRIAAYDHFFDLCASVQDQEVTIQSQKEEFATNPSDKRKEQIQANLSALRAARNEAINHYNADAMKTATQGQFRSSHLPFQLDPTQERTTCAV